MTAENLDPAEEVQELLRRVESLIVDAQRWDDDQRGVCVDLTKRVYEAAIAGASAES